MPAVAWDVEHDRRSRRHVSVTLGAFHNIRPYDVTLVSVTPIDGDGSITVAGIDVAGPQRTGSGRRCQLRLVPAGRPVARARSTPAAGFVLRAASR